jgi:hypothetical protein
LKLLIVLDRIFEKSTFCTVSRSSGRAVRAAAAERSRLVFVQAKVFC